MKQKWLIIFVIAFIGVACSSKEKSKPVPDAPTISVSPRNQASIIEWEPYDSSKQYRLYWSTDPTLPLAQWQVIDNVTSPYTHQGLSNEVQYHYYIVALDANGKSQPSNIVVNIPKLPPQAPVLKTPVAAETQISLSWNAVEDADYYVVYMAQSPAVSPQNYQSLPGGIQLIADNQTSISIQGLTFAKNYYFVVTAANESGESESASNTVQSSLLVVPPSITIVEARDWRATIEWPAVAGAQSYNLYIAQQAGVEPGNSNELSGYIAYPNVQSPFTLQNLMNYQNYHAVLAVDNVAGVEGNASAEITLTPKNSVPISAGFEHACAIGLNQALWCWGNNKSGELGRASSDNVKAQPNIVIGDHQWVDISAGDRHTCAINHEGKLGCWGGNTALQSAHLGVTNSTPTILENKTNWRDIASGQYHTCGLDAQGDIYCWGDDTSFQLGNAENSFETAELILVENGSVKWTSLSVGATHTCGIKANAELWCWGAVNNSSLGHGSGAGSPVPVIIASQIGWVSVSAGATHTCGIKTNGSLWCWGKNDRGQTGTGSPNNPVVINTPQQVGIALDWLQVVAARGVSCAINIRYELFCWGSNLYGVLGPGNSALQEQSSMSQIPGNDWKVITGKLDFICGLKMDDSMVCWGSNHNGQLTYQTNDGFANFAKSSPTRVDSGTDWIEVSSGLEYSCARKIDNSIWCWGINSNGQLGNNATAPEAKPVQANSATVWQSISIGSNSACAVSTTGQMYCWGNNGVGKLALGGTNNIDVLTPTQESLMLSNWDIIDINVDHACGLLKDKSLWCWGGSANGRLGISNDGLTNKTSATQVVHAAQWHSISSGSNFSCGTGQVTLPDMSVSDNLYCWGAQGNVRNGAVSDVFDPMLIAPENQWQSVSAGAGHACAIDMNNALHCWGGNTFSQLGIDTLTEADTVDIPTAISIADNSGWKKVDTQFNHTCALKSNGFLYCWGRSRRGQVGNGTITSSPSAEVNVQTPAQIGTAEWLDVATGDHHTCAVKTNNTLWCWGDNVRGQLGDGTAFSRELVSIQLPK